MTTNHAMAGKLIRIFSPSQRNLHNQVGLVIGDYGKLMVRMPDGREAVEYGYPVFIPLLHRSILAKAENMVGLGLPEWSYPK